MLMTQFPLTIDFDRMAIRVKAWTKWMLWTTNFSWFCYSIGSDAVYTVVADKQGWQMGWWDGGMVGWDMGGTGSKNLVKILSLVIRDWLFIYVYIDICDWSLLNCVVATIFQNKPIIGLCYFGELLFVRGTFKDTVHKKNHSRLHISS